MILTELEIAKICHEANRAYCKSLGDHTQPTWEAAPDWQRDSALHGVQAHLKSELAPEQSHEVWLAEKKAQGWVWGPVKNTVTREHPCLVAYGDLPQEQRVKDFLFAGIVKALAPFVSD